MACKQTTFSKNISKESLLHATFFTFAKESGSLKEKGTRHGPKCYIRVLCGRKIYQIFIPSSRNIQNFEKIDLQNSNCA